MSKRHSRVLAAGSVLAILLPGTAIQAAIEVTPSDNASRIRNDQWHLRYLSAQEAHRMSQGEGVTVAILDTGVSQHPDIRLNLKKGKNLLPGDSSSAHDDPNGHGTAMAGLIAAHGQNATKGALGIAPKAQVIPIKTSDASNGGNADRLAEGIEFAITAGAAVVSISGGGGPSPRLLQALEAAHSANVIVVAAGGNNPTDPGVIYPAAADTVIAVGGIDQNGKHARISVTGPQLDLAAPALDIFSLDPQSDYRRSSGTSNAAAIVAGAAALIRAKYPYLPADEVAHRLTATAIDKGPPGRDDQYGYGVIDLVAALTADVPPRGFGPSGSATPGPGTTRAGGPEADQDGAAVRGLVTLAVLLAAGAGGVWWVRRRRRSDDPPPRISR
ncbi:type VII secretion-associated serine protease mycosin [Verrucosispora sp. SN26_14.1]|uniref:type VII secretion-associated serine protease mycosin n=1 Tax=Verrucosispora sp. SN26_14.1 TaxID=2527879 RepID=UPI001F398040|nr:type VII secretion-associated serine protease mycosin [Verrucosispora sp. SN26_14.1]